MAFADEDGTFDNSRLEVFRFVGDGMAKKISLVGGSVKPSGAGNDWFEVTIPAAYANADFAATVDTDECAGTNKCDGPKDGGKCVNKVGTYMCTCLKDYVSTAGDAPGVEFAPGTQR